MPDFYVLRWSKTQQLSCDFLPASYVTRQLAVVLDKRSMLGAAAIYMSSKWIFCSPLSGPSRHGAPPAFPHRLHLLQRGDEDKIVTVDMSYEDPFLRKQCAGNPTCFSGGSASNSLPVFDIIEANTYR